MNEISVVKCCNHEARIFHQEKDAPTCIYLFGALQDINTIGVFTEELSKHYNFIAIELPGSGRTEPLSPTHTFQYLAECLNEVLLKIVGHESIRIVACSYGTAVAVEWAKRYPNRLNQLVLAGSMSRLPEKHWPTLFNLMHRAYGEKSDFAAGFMDLMMNESINQKRFTGIKKAAIRKARNYADVLFQSFIYNTIRLLSHDMGDVSHIGAPVLVTTGEYDPFCEIEEAILLARKFPNNQFIPLENCDHLFHIEDPDQLIEVVMKFFERAPKRIEFSQFGEGDYAKAS